MNIPNPPTQETNLYVTLPSGETFIRKTFSEYTKDELIKIIGQCNNIKHVLDVLKINKVYHYKFKEFILNNNVSTEHFKTHYYYTPYNNKNIKSYSKFKEKLIKENKLINKCVICNIDPFWNNKKMTLQLDHINGNNTDNRIENLRLLCPNCHSQTDTYTGRNTKKNKNEIIIPTVELQNANEIKPTINPIKYTCKDCNIEITNKGKKGMCQPCYKKTLRIVERPSYDVLLNEIHEHGYVQTGKKYGVSDNSIRKWIKNYTKNVKDTPLSNNQKVN